MSPMAVHAIDPKPLLTYMAKNRGECSFDEAMEVLQKHGLSESDARDGIWRLLSNGTICFTDDRRLRLPPAVAKIAG